MTDYYNKQGSYPYIVCEHCYRGEDEITTITIIYIHKILQLCWPCFYRQTKAGKICSVCKESLLVSASSEPRYCEDGMLFTCSENCHTMYQLQIAGTK